MNEKIANKKSIKNNKRHLRADDYLSLSSALRPRLLDSAINNLFKVNITGSLKHRLMFPFSLVSSIIITSIISGILLPNLFGTASNVSAASLTLSVPSSISLNINPATSSSSGSNGTYAKSSNSNITIRTDANFGYTLSIKANNNNNDLVNGSSKLSSITNTEGISEDNYKTSGANNTWGYIPSKLNSRDNTNIMPGPTSTNTTIEKTTQANTNNNNTYTIALVSKIDNTLSSGTYKNSFVISAVSNSVSYSITYNLNQGTWNGKSPQTGTTTESTITLDSHTPTRTNYTFEGWCTVEPTNNSTTNPTCSGQTYTANQAYTLTNGDNTANLYAIWKQNGRSYTINYHSNLGSPTGMPSTQTGVALPTSYSAVLSSNTPTLSGYTFQGWCISSTSSTACSGSSYDAGDSITISSDGQVIDLYAKWRTPTYGDSCQSGKGKILKDNKCWQTSDASSGTTWANAASFCKSPWKLPSKEDFDALLLAYYPDATYEYGGYNYNRDPTELAADWSDVRSWWWTSTGRNSTYAYGFGVIDHSAYTANNFIKTYNYRVRCVSE